MRSLAVTLASVALVGALHCGGSAGDDAPAPATPTTPDAGGSTAGDSDAGSLPPPTRTPAVACGDATAIAAIAACIDGGGAPRKCLADVAPAPCDGDQDGLDDALEDAMIRSYAPVFAFNRGDGDHKTGDSESVFPDNLEHYVSGATLIWRVDDDEGTRKVVDAKPTLDGLAAATFEGHAASSSKLGDGTNFWLCLNKPGGDYPKDALVASMEASQQLANGIDVLSVAHLAGKDPKGEYVLLTYMLFYPYNRFTLDNHEGDFEGGGVFVSLDTGKVAALYTDRHPSSDGITLVPLEGTGKLSAKDPVPEAPHYDVCSDTSTDAIGGVRFWDFATNQHHPVIYTSGGDHASYSYPGATKLQGAGCFEGSIIRDVHNGNGPKLVPFDDAYYTAWGIPEARTAIPAGVHFKNLGERDHLREAWSAYVGEWGCTLDKIPKSYPGPWDNERLCRHWLTNDWGDGPPFTPPRSSDCKGQ